MVPGGRSLVNTAGVKFVFSSFSVLQCFAKAQFAANFLGILIQQTLQWTVDLDASRRKNACCEIRVCVCVSVSKSVSKTHDQQIMLL